MFDYGVLTALGERVREWFVQHDPTLRLTVGTALGIFMYAVYTSLWYFPIFYKKQPRFGDRRSYPSTIAHRGSRGEGLPENTIAAFRDAVDANADVVEFDVWLTADNKVVVHHDATLTRMTCGASDMKITDVKHADIPPITLTKAQAHRTHHFKKKECLTIPLFEEVLAAVPHHTILNIEFKQESDRLISEVLRILDATDRKHDVFWFSLDERINSKLRAADKTIPTITSINSVLKYLILYYTGLLPFFTITDSVFGITVEEITLEKIQHERATADLPPFVQRLIAYCFAGKPPYPMVAPGLFAHLRRRGVQIWFIGINTEADLDIAVRAGATGVLTDKIHWLQKTIREKNIVFKKID